MGIPSPFLAAKPSPLLKSRQYLSPELGLLELAGDLPGVDELLPTAACDNPCVVEARAESLAGSDDSGSATGSGAASRIDDRGVSEEDDPECSAPSAHRGAFDPAAAAFVPACEREFAGEAAAGAAAGFTGHAAGTAGEHVKMWCWVRKQDDATVIVPCVDEASVSAAKDAGEAVLLWCWQQPDSRGGVMVVPLTDKRVEAEAASAAELACAPPAAAEGAYAPQWARGPCWPFSAPPTTLVLGGLPRGLTQELLLEVLDRENFSGFYDFVYLAAADDEGREGGGVAVVNLTRHEYGLALAARLHGRTSWPTDGDDEDACPCEVNWSLPLQGRSALVQSYRDHPSNGQDLPEHMRPQLFETGFPTAFPLPSAAPGPFVALAHRIW